MLNIEFRNLNTTLVEVNHIKCFTFHIIPPYLNTTLVEVNRNNIRAINNRVFHLNTTLVEVHP